MSGRVAQAILIAVAIGLNLCGYHDAASAVAAVSLVILVLEASE